jgi:exonuclease, DNA polymerase III, epsilon subunit family
MAMNKNKELLRKTICVFDLETTGFNMFSPDDPDRVIDIGIVKMVNGQVADRLQFYINPEGKQSSPDALKVHGITDHFLRDKPTFKECARQILTFIKGSVLCAHNGEFFDFDFLEAEFQRLKPDFKLNDYIDSRLDTLILAKAFRTGKNQKNNLDALAKDFNVDDSARVNSGLHGALIDADILANVLVKMCETYDLDRFAFFNDNVFDFTPEYLNDLNLADMPKVEVTEQDLKEEQHYHQFIVSNSGGKVSTIAVDNGLIQVDKNQKDVSLSLTP